MGYRKKKPRDNSLAERYRAGDFDPEKVFEKDEASDERFSARSKNAEANKTAKTAATRASAAEAAALADPSAVDAKTHVGQITQVYSLFCDVEFEGQKWLCVTRKTLNKVADSATVVGDRVEFRETGGRDESGRPEGVVERVLPRETVLTRADSFKGRTQQPIVANAGQMLIVASVRHPAVKWGLIDRMIVAARSGGLVPIVCLNKIDLVEGEVHVAEGKLDDETLDPRVALDYYLSLGVRTLRTSVEKQLGLDELRDVLKGRITVLAGHSGVGKSSLIRSIQPALDIRIGEVSEFTAKGRHTTTSARHYPLDFGGAVVDTPGVKLFGLWGVTGETLGDYFSDVTTGTAPPWRVQSFERIKTSLGD